MTMAISTRRGGGDLEEYDNGEAPASTAMVEVASNRAAQEVQAAMVVAKKFPRDTIAAYNRIMQTCRRKGLAKASMYEYPRGGEKISGPSIRLAEALAQNWGNVDFGIVELEQRQGESTVMAYAWDLETNTRQTKIFQVRHERHTRKGSYELTDPRDIYELVANQGARRLRACILGIIPGDIIDAAVDECERTLANANGEGPLVDRVRAMIAAFSDLQVTQAMIEKLLSHKADTVSERELIRLRKIYTSIRDGQSQREAHFDVHAGETGAASELETRMKHPSIPAGAARSEQRSASVPPAQADELTTDQQPGGVDEQQEPPEEEAQATERLTPEREWAEFKTDCFDAMKVNGLTPPQMAKAWRDAMVAAGVKGKETTYPEDKRRELYEACAEATGHFAKPK